MTHNPPCRCYPGAYYRCMKHNPLQLDRLSEAAEEARLARLEAERKRRADSDKSWDERWGR